MNGYTASLSAMPLIATDGGVGDILDHGFCLDRSVALTFEGLFQPHSMLVGSGCIHPSVVESFCMVLVHLQPVVIVIVCHAIAGNQWRSGWCS